MKAAVFYGPGHIKMHSDLAEPTASAGEVVIKVAACGICGSDLAMFRMDTHRQGLVRTVDGREIPGHEFAGVITALGAGVTGFAVGDRVVGVGMGGMAEYVPIPANPYQLVLIPEGVSFEEAATTEPMADALQMLRLAELQDGENVVVFGVGIIGLGVIQALKASAPGAAAIIAIDVSDARLEMAMRAGATHTINPARQDVMQAVREICGTQLCYMEMPPQAHPAVAVVFDCAGYMKHMPGDPPLQTALAMIRPTGARIICFGAYEGKFSIDFMPMIYKQPVIKGSMGYAPAELAQSLALMASGALDRRQFISRVFPLEQVQEAFEFQGNGQAIKVLLKPDSASLGN